MKSSLSILVRQGFTLFLILAATAVSQATTFTVTNVSDSGAGSLRAAIASAAGTGSGLPHTIAFDIPLSLLTGAVGEQRAVITLSSPLDLSGANLAGLTIDGTTQTTNKGDTNPGTLGQQGFVGVSNLVINAVNRPEVELAGSSSAFSSIIQLNSTSQTLRGLAIHGGSTQAVLVGAGSSVAGFVIESCLIGTTAVLYGFPTDGTHCGVYGINVLRSEAGIVRNNLIGFTSNSGLRVDGGTGSSVVRIVGNQFNQNGYTDAGGDAISLGDGSGATSVQIRRNLFVASNSSAVQFEIGYTSTSSVTENSMISCGLGGAGTALNSLEGSAVCYLQRTGSTNQGSTTDSIARNIVHGSQASAVVVGYGQRNVIITQNAIFTNGTSTLPASLSIDLIATNAYVGAPAPNSKVYGDGDGISANDGSLGTGTITSANHGMDYPVFTKAQLNSAGTQLTVSGYIGTAPGNTNFAGSKIELFEADTSDLNQYGNIFTSDGRSISHGEARRYLGTFTTGSSGTFTDQVITVSDVVVGNGICATAYLATKGSSEVSPVRLVTPPTPGANPPPVASDVTNPVLANTLGSTPLTASLTGTDDGSVVSFTIVGLPSAASGILYYYNGVTETAVAVNDVIPYANRANLRFDPAAGHSGYAVVQYTALDNGGATSLNTATLTIPINNPPVANPVVNGATLNYTDARTSISGLSGYDLDGTIDYFTITSLPPASAGKLYYDAGTGSGAQLVIVGTQVNYTRATYLSFNPSDGDGTFSGTASFLYSATDNDGTVSISTAQYTIPIIGAATPTGNQPPVADSKTSANVAPSNGTRTALSSLSGSDPDGTVSGYTITTLPATGTLYYDNGTDVVPVVIGTSTASIPASRAAFLSFMPANGTSGTVNFKYSAVDNLGLSSVSPATFSIVTLSTLPVELTRFTAQAQGRGALLRWETASEQNSAHFTIERSATGTDFQAIGQLPAQGVSSKAVAYTFTDEKAGLAGAPLYYRLRQVDLDGTSSLSPVRTVHLEASTAQLELHPNPAATSLTLDLGALPAGTYAVQVLNVRGQVVLNTSLEAGRAHELALAGLPAGAYALRVRGTGTSLSRSFVKLP